MLYGLSETMPVPDSMSKFGDFEVRGRDEGLEGHMPFSSPALTLTPRHP